MSRRKLTVPVPAFVLGASLALTGCFDEVHSLGVRDRFEKTLDFPSGGTFRLENVNGTVTVEAWDRESVSIEAEKAAPSERALEEIKIDVREERSGVEVVTRFPKRRGFFSGHRKVDYVIRVPAQARVEVETVNGKVQVEGIRERVRASTVNGSVELRDVSGEVEASTVNGSISAHYLKPDDQGRHRFSTTNGGVRLELPPDVSGDFEARTVNGSIKTDFPLEVSGKVGRRLRGRLGEGRARFHITTVNGSVRLLKF